MIWAHHLCLGHPPFSLLKHMFPLFFKDLVVLDFQCEVCQFAKHCRTSFPINSMECNLPFTLIHSDIWRLAKIPDIHGARQFVSFIDDYSRATWLFLMKDNSEVSSLLLQFQKIFFTQFRAKIKWFRLDNVRDYFIQSFFLFLSRKVLFMNLPVLKSHNKTEKLSSPRSCSSSFSVQCSKIPMGGSNYNSYLSHKSSSF